ncbi:helix-turn-helix domain-containing protein [Micromonospora sp. NBC_01796]|uniref:helix-turn-helix domain-containing protein n=1 Tax=Micromonospora sp. NBC_01796 TaxID=2975987 RepID=UPI002DDA64C3|nr:helix-turn-helix transcriptional regulator [Micromonospora sp. NBC_01796]WSA82832.1 helix-turn-helix domain-containing protein [Micromonospora sp. NBC_01796]
MSSNQTGSDRGALGARLRELRAREGISGINLASRLGWVQSKVSRIETGRQLPTEDDVRAWGAVIDADEPLLDELLRQLRALRGEHIAWRRGASDAAQAGTQRSMMELAAEATLVRNFELGVVPGLLQTADYARVRLAENVEFHGAPGDDLEDALLLRIQRQQVLYDSTKQFRFLVTESVLRMSLCPVDVMRGQLDRLTALTGMSNVELGVIPTEARLPLAPLHGFVMFDDTVTVETWAEEQTWQTAADALRFGRIFDRLHEVARHGEDARDIIQATLAGLATPA